MTPLPQHLTSQQVSHYLKAISDVRDRAIVLLFLTTGVFLNEIVDITIHDINWEKRLVHIGGNRKRDIPLNNQAFEALAQWSKERITTSESTFFLTTKGKVSGLTSRGVDTMLRKYAKQAGLSEPVNAHILRNTFAIRLFEEQPNLSTKKAKELLGIKDTESLNRYRIRDEE